jgi:DNA-binding NarL/FixJ family response regulator
MKLSKLTKPELDYFLKNANFTEEEEKVFIQCSKGKSIQEIAFSVGVCDRTINRRIAAIYAKIKRLEVYANGNSDN